MKKIILSLAFAFGAFAHADAVSAVSDPAVMGRWQSVAAVYTGSGILIYMGMEFSTTNAIMSSICKFPNGKVLEAKVTVPVNVGNGSMQTTGSGQNEVKDGSETCNVNVSPGTVQYAMVGANLRLSAGGHVLDFARR